MAELFHPIQLKTFRLESNILVAPLAGYTNLPTRLAYRKNARSNTKFVSFAEMVSADGLFYSFDKSAKLLDSSDEDSPLGIQIFCSDVEKVKRIFDRIKDYKFDILDLNCGCSIKKVLKSKCGAYLLKSPENIYKILSYLVRATDRPVSLKIRSGYNKESINYLEVLDAAEQAGAQMITFHPRTCMQLFNGHSDWSLIADMKSRAHIPVIGNGDLLSVDDVESMFEQTHCDGIMLARGLIDDPFMIGRVECRLAGKTFSEPTVEQRVSAMLNHASSMIDYMGEFAGLREFRKFIRGYLKSLPEVANLRYQLNFTDNFDEFFKLVRDFFHLS